MSLELSESEVKGVRVSRDEMDWDAYARHYDEMCALNPAYQENVELLLDRLKVWALPKAPRVCDIGAGTGNYIAALHHALPDASFTYVDFDERMIGTAKSKHEALGIGNVRYVKERAQDLGFPEDSFDLIIGINAIYAISPQKDILRKARTWLKPGGKLFLIDFGRKQNTADWTYYIFRESLKSGKLVRYFKALVTAREVLRQNRQTTKGQNTGRYWLHSTEEFESALIDSGYRVEEAFPCYRGYADCAVCSRR